jgi:type II secretory pathway pseudopilin PulG
VDARGYSAIELVFTMGIAVTVGGVAIPQMLVSVDEVRTAGAARYIAGQLQHARMQAAARSAEVALRFSLDARGYTFAVYVDGNRNGVLAADISSGIDRQVGAPDRLPEKFTGVDIGVLPGLPAVESGSAPPGVDPLKLGASNSASFSPLGTSSSGSVYVKGRGRTQYVVRLYGETGKTRILKFNAQRNTWQPL